MSNFSSYRLLGLSLSLAILSGCETSDDSKIVEKAPPVTAEDVNSTPPPKVDNPSAPPLTPAEGNMPKGETKPMAGETPAVSDTPAAPTETPKPE